MATKTSVATKKIQGRGWPRKFIDDGEGKKRPNLWLGGDNQLSGDWLTFDIGRTDKAGDNYLCVVCGLRLRRLIVFGDAAGWGRPSTNGPGCHPRCFAMALKFCPRFSDRCEDRYEATDSIVAWLWDARCKRPWWSRKYHVAYDPEAKGYMRAAGPPEATGTYRLSNVSKMTRLQCQELAKSNPLGQ